MKQRKLFPLLPRVCFVGTELADFPFPPDRRDNLINVFPAHAPLTHLEVSSGRHVGRSQFVDERWFLSLESFIIFVSRFVAATLEVYMETHQSNFPICCATGLPTDANLISTLS